MSRLIFFFTGTATTGIYTLSLHDALPIFAVHLELDGDGHRLRGAAQRQLAGDGQIVALGRDRKSTRLNSSHMSISYAVFCLKKKKRKQAFQRIIHSDGTQRLPVPRAPRIA